MAGNGGIIGPVNEIVQETSVSEKIHKLLIHQLVLLLLNPAPSSACGVRTADILVIAGGGGGGGGDGGSQGGGAGGGAGGFSCSSCSDPVTWKLCC